MNIKIIKSKRKTLSLQVNVDLSITVRAPFRISDKEIVRFIKEKEPWINKQIQKLKEQQDEYEQKHKKLSMDEIEELADRAVKCLPERVSYFATIVGVDYGRITIRNQKTRWGSCSTKGNLNFNCRLMLMPTEVIDYVVVHELCHRIEMNHSKAFWNEVGRVLPNYKKQQKWLKENGRFY